MMAWILALKTVVFQEWQVDCSEAHPHLKKYKLRGKQVPLEMEVCWGSKLGLLKILKKLEI
jgi:hypothetical protein